MFEKISYLPWEETYHFEILKRIRERR
jgi:hypothetical protein